MRLFLFFFFFSSRRRHTRSLRDWSSTCALPICGRPRGCLRARSGRSSCFPEPERVDKLGRTALLDRRDRISEEVDRHEEVVVALLVPLSPDLDPEHAGCAHRLRFQAQASRRMESCLHEALCVVLVLLVPQRAAREAKTRELRAVAGNDVADARAADEAERPRARPDELPEV